jgi:hypothetical protein|tara:strand:+ start:1310 stop:1600 length:291 start_codon:yes stop_codon:yes gene_type:complete
MYFGKIKGKDYVSISKAILDDVAYLLKKHKNLPTKVLWEYKQGGFYANQNTVCIKEPWHQNCRFGEIIVLCDYPETAQHIVYLFNMEKIIDLLPNY